MTPESKIVLGEVARTQNQIQQLLEESEALCQEARRLLSESQQHTQQLRLTHHTRSLIKKTFNA